SHSEFILPKTLENIGTESQGAARVRKHRETKKLLQSNVPVTIGNSEIEKELELELEKELDLELEPQNHAAKDDAMNDCSCKYSLDFLEFWQQYPRKKEKLKGWRAWKTRLREKCSPEKMIAAARDESKCCQLVADYEKSIIRVSARRCQKQEQQRLIKRIDALSEQSKIGKRFQNRRFETFGITQENKAAYERCYHYAQQFVPNSEGLLLIGGVGTGKTHLSVAIMHELMKKNICGLFITVPDLLQKIRSGFDKKNEQAEAFMQAIQRAQLLILDDLGAEKNNEWTQEQLYMIVNARYESMLPTIITSNCSVEELKIRIGTRSVSRIIEMCDGVICKGLDYREKNRM
ncbi:MAG: IstB-like ATP-binding protein, partial [Firmicutes bacterium]|nr:IstB-like ATP-binding protein [Bacillota bacterium]